MRLLLTEEDVGRIIAYLNLGLAGERLPGIDLEGYLVHFLRDFDRPDHYILRIDEKK